MDGHKVLFEDDVFCEFAVFEAHELVNIPFAEGKIIWKEVVSHKDCHQKKTETVNGCWEKFHVIYI